VMTPHNAAYVAHTYTEVVSLLNGAGVPISVDI
jgi:hypothetical protein